MLRKEALSVYLFILQPLKPKTDSDIMNTQNDSLENINELTRRVIGCAMDVHSKLGNGFQEVIYQRALSLELNNNMIVHERELEIPVFYKGLEVGTRRVDFLVERRLMVEIKAVENLERIHKTQAINYCEAYDIADGLLLNFGSSSLQINRVFNSKTGENYGAWLAAKRGDDEKARDAH
jgi:GxxExxY protein